MSTGSRPHIVVGIEGTHASEAALEWAVREAGLRGCPLTVVHAWSFDPVRDAGRTNEHAERRASACMIGAEVASAMRKVGVTPEIVEHSVHGSPAKVLVRASVGAELLVLGRGHRSGIIDVLRHSVSADCVRNAASPVVVIPSSWVDSHAHGSLAASG